jgi:hypothetical protein
MAKKTVIVRRNSVNGRFVSQDYVKTHPKYNRDGASAEEDVKSWINGCIVNLEI